MFHKTVMIKKNCSKCIVIVRSHKVMYIISFYAYSMMVVQKEQYIADYVKVHCCVGWYLTASY